MSYVSDRIPMSFDAKIKWHCINMMRECNITEKEKPIKTPI